MLAIVGSMMWMMPSPRQRVQAILRQHAMRSGLQVQISNLLFPRAIGEHVADERHCTAYRLGRTKSCSASGYIPWHVFRLQAHANTGLPAGWCWGKGEGDFDADKLGLIAQMINAMPADVYSIESTPVAVSVYWNENGKQETVDQMKIEMQRLIDCGL